MKLQTVATQQSVFGLVKIQVITDYPKTGAIVSEYKKMCSKAFKIGFEMAKNEATNLQIVKAWNREGVDITSEDQERILREVRL